MKKNKKRTFSKCDYCNNTSEHHTIQTIWDLMGGPTFTWCPMHDERSILAQKEYERGRYAQQCADKVQS